MATITEAEALKYKEQATPLAKELYAKSEDYRRLVAAYFFREKCRKNIWTIGMRVGRLNNQQADYLVYHRTGYWNFNNDCYPWPLNDDMYVNMYYMQRSYLSIIGLGGKIKNGPYGDLYKRLQELEYKLEDYNAEHWYKTFKMEDNGALLVNTEYSRYYDLSVSDFINAIHAFKEPDTRRYMSVSKTDKKAYEIAAEIKKDVNDFCSWNGFKHPDVTIPAGYVYFGSIRK